MTASQDLTSLTERDETPTEGVKSNLDAIVSSPVPTPKTPGDSSPIKPPMSEMHPSKVHHTTGPPSSSLRLGFTDIKPAAHGAGAAQGTPTKVGVPSSPFSFRFTRQAADIKLGPEAQRMMDDIREEAQKIKAELAAKRDLEKQEEEQQTNNRKIARPKGKAGRFSAAHMAEFKKMDSIENHPSAFRAQPGRFTPSKGLKRTQSRANLNDSARGKKSTPATSASPSKSKHSTKEDDEQIFPAKRARQLIEDDASSRRPVSRDGSSIPRPKSSGKDHHASLRPQSSLASLMTPTKASMARTAPAKTPLGSLARSPSKPNLSGIKQPVIAASKINNGTMTAPNVASPSITVQSPRSRFGKVKSLLRVNKTSPIKEMTTGIPLPSQSFSTFAATSASASPTRADKATPSLASATATPARKLSKRMKLTPETKRLAMENSPSPLKSGLPRPTSRQILGEVRYPTLDSVMAKDSTEGTVSYPDLSGYRPLPEPAEKQKPANAPRPGPGPGPGTFTFRSDHTINFGDVSPGGFGSSPGQSSVRQVRQSIMPTANMPGSFPASMRMSTSPNKENKAPPSQPAFRALPHGMINKKRHRVSTDEEDAEKEAAERAAKKRKNAQVPEGDALLAPRLVGASAKKPMMSPQRFGTPGGAGTPSPKKKAMLSLSRLNMLARPKLRK